MARLTAAQRQQLEDNRKLFVSFTGSGIDEYFADYAYISDLYERICDDLGLKKISSAAGIWVHGSPARSLEEVTRFLAGDAHDRSKVQWFDGKSFRPLVIEES